VFRRIALITLASVALSAAPALAGGSTVTGTIDVAPSIASQLRYGDTVYFSTTVTGRLASKSKVYVTVVCTQDGRLVYQWSAARDLGFPLVDQAGAGLDWRGGAASCEATLVYKVPDGRSYAYYWLDQTTFAVAG
jgi:hypothetical protein